MSFSLTRRDFISFTLGGTASLVGLFLSYKYQTRPVPIIRPDDSKVTLFLHIPKTGGTTLRHHLDKNVMPARLIVPDTALYVNEIRHRYSHFLNEKDFIYIRGHLEFDWNVFLDEYKEHTQGVIILRDPVSRFRSTYSYQIEKWAYEGMYGKRLVDLRPQSLSEVVDIIKEDVRQKKYSTNMFYEVNNGMTRRLSGVGTKAPFGEMTPDMLKTAKKNLKERFAVTGLTEEYNKFLYLLVNKLGWDINPSIHKNTSKKKINITEEDRKAILSLNRLDAQLYEYAQTLFEEQWNALGQDKIAQYEDFLSTAEKD